MSLGRLASTRLELLRARRRLERSTRGAALLRRKRERLVTELFRLAHPAEEARARIATAAAEAWPALLDALAERGVRGVRSSGWPVGEPALVMEAGSVWGIPVARIVSRHPLARTPEARNGTVAEMGASVARAAEAFERLADLLLDAAPEEMLLQRLGVALGRTSRQVQTLEHRVAPRLSGEIARVRQVLEEREREERLRLRGRLGGQRSR
ncbi:MAG TPA: V-type ATP synthase subunit D [Gemmatimonadales bacterium]|nr:V-type ATP synthase subunit D [Gemmatimonadales bacterium]